MDFIAGKRHWAKFWRFADRIARIGGSAYNTALRLDPKIAAETAKLPKSKNPQLWRFTPEMHLLTDIGDLLLKRIAKDPQTAALPRPLTAVDYLSVAKRQARMDRTVALFSPRHAHLSPRISA